MKFDYDWNTDSLYIKLTDKPSIESSEVSPGVVFDYDAEGKVVGIDIEYASKAQGFLALLTQIPLRQAISV